MGINIRYKVGGKYYSQEEYEKEFGPIPDRSKTWDGDRNFKRAQFYPYYDHALGTYCTSFRDQEQKVKEFNERQRQLPPEKRDPQHPKGFVFAQDTKNWKEIKDWKKYGGDIRREQQKSRQYRDDPMRYGKHVKRKTYFC